MRTINMAIGFESANGFVKTVSDVHQEAYLNTIREITDIATEKDLIARQYGKTVFKVGGKHYQISSLENSKSSSGDSVNRYKTDEYKIESLIAIFKHLQKIDTSDCALNVYVATGVPANHYNISSVTENLDENLLGKHTVNDVEFEIVSMASTLQPLASFVRKILNGDGSPNKTEINKYMANDHKILIADIGFGSTDYAEIVSGSLKKSRKSEGMREVYEGILNRAYEKEEMLRSFSLNEFYIEGEMKKGNSIKIGQYNVDVTTEKHDEYKKKVSNVANEMNQNGLKYSTYDEICFVGGGTLALDKELKEEFGDDPRVFFCKDAQFENARGYLIKAKSNLLKEGVAS